MWAPSSPSWPASSCRPSSAAASQTSCASCRRAWWISFARLYARRVLAARLPRPVLAPLPVLRLLPRKVIQPTLGCGHAGPDAEGKSLGMAQAKALLPARRGIDHALGRPGLAGLLFAPALLGGDLPLGRDPLWGVGLRHLPSIAEAQRPCLVAENSRPSARTLVDRQKWPAAYSCR